MEKRENRKAATREGETMRKQGWKSDGRRREVKVGWMWSNGVRRASFVWTRCCMCVPVIWGRRCILEAKWLCGEKKRWNGKKPEPGCLPRCCSLRPLTGTSTLFNNTTRGKLDSTKTLIYTSLHVFFPFCFLSFVLLFLISPLVFPLLSVL